MKEELKLKIKEETDSLLQELAPVISHLFQIKHQSDEAQKAEQSLKDYISLQYGIILKLIQHRTELPIGNIP